ncbi:MAG: hypothetical protein WAW41_14725 [Methylobacter sp.]
MTLLIIKTAAILLQFLPVCLTKITPQSMSSMLDFVSRPSGFQLYIRGERKHTRYILNLEFTPSPAGEGWGEEILKTEF